MNYELTSIPILHYIQPVKKCQSFAIIMQRFWGNHTGFSRKKQALQKKNVSADVLTGLLPMRVSAAGKTKEPRTHIASRGSRVVRVFITDVLPTRAIQRIKRKSPGAYCVQTQSGGAGDRDRTGTMLPSRDFKSRASACSATPAFCQIILSPG